MIARKDRLTCSSKFAFLVLDQDYENRVADIFAHYLYSVKSLRMYVTDFSKESNTSIYLRL